MSATFRRMGLAILMMLAGSHGAAAPAGTTDAAHGHWTPTSELIAGTEHWLRMPAGTRLDDYSRYYYGSIENGRRLLIGTFIRDGEHRGVQITTEDKAPHVFDGGCYQVSLIYDVDAKQTVLIRCNGLA